MLKTQRRMTSEDFYERLAGLRAKIDTVPEQHRALLEAAADNAQRQHERMKRTNARIDDMVADLGLIVEHTKFHVAACRRELRDLDPQGHFSL